MIRRASWPSWAVALFALLGCAARPPAASTHGFGGARADNLEAELASAFRIDLSHIAVTFDLEPQLGGLVGHARLNFRMRPGQDKALFHFNPPLQAGTVRDLFTEIRLDGKQVRLADNEQLKLVRTPGSPELGFEIQRPLAQETEHVLEITWAQSDWFTQRDSDWFLSEVDDTDGTGGESMWPTINSPEELTRHEIQLRIHDSREYVALGSGTITQQRESDGTQVLKLDSERSIASYTMLVAALPAEDVNLVRFEVNGTPVTIASNQIDSTTAEARAIIERTLPQLANDFGPYPAPFLNVLLTDWEDGMEFFGATHTGVDSLEHELVHMYWGCSGIGRTWRDTWLDEAIAVWWTERDELDKLPSNFSSDMVSGRTSIEPAFDLRAYEEGAQMLDEVAGAIGGDAALLAFLKRFHQRRLFTPFTTQEFTDELVATTGDQALRERFDGWLSTHVSCSPIDSFEQLWRDFDENYAFFELREVDWQAQYESHRPLVDKHTTAGELFTVLSEMLRPLNDAHVTLEGEDGTEFSAGGTPNFFQAFSEDQVDQLDRIRQQNLADAGFGTVRKATSLIRYQTSSRLGYLRIRAFEGPSKKRLKRALDRLLGELSELEGLIIDIRGNPGGEDAIAYAIANRFVALQQEGHHKWTKTGPANDSFGDRETWMLEPEGATQFTAPIVLLTNGAAYSAADVFALAMTQIPHVTLIGEPTAGVFSDMLERELPNGWSYTMSHQSYCAPNGECYEGVGVPVDQSVQNTPEDLATGRDSVLCAALESLGHEPTAVRRTGSELDRVIREYMTEHDIPGLAAGIVKEGTLAWSGEYGWADIENEIPVTPETTFAIASISKTVTATALMQLVDLEALKLNEEVSKVATFPVENPRHPQNPITFRQLLTHTSSIRDAQEVYGGSYAPGDPSISLKEFAQSYFVTSGANYSGQNFLKQAPGEEYEYSNIAYGLLGHLIEELSGESFESFTQRKIFEPLGMTSTSWHIEGLDRARLVVPYEWDETRDAHRAIPHYGFPTFPDGGLRTTVADFSQYMIMHLAGGQYEEHTILSPAAARQMATVQFPDVDSEQGLAFALPSSGVLYHSGGDPGVATEMVLFTDTGLGIVIFANFEADLDPLLGQLIKQAREL